MDKTAKSVVFNSEVEAILQPSMDILKVKKSRTILRHPAALGIFYFIFFFVSVIYYCSVVKAGWDESRLRLATGCCPAGPALGATPLHTVVTYRLTFMAQHAPVDFLGQDQVARLRSGTDSVTVLLSPCAPGRVGQPSAKQKCA